MNTTSSNKNLEFFDRGRGHGRARGYGMDVDMGMLVVELIISRDTYEVGT